MKITTKICCCFQCLGTTLKVFDFNKGQILSQLENICQKSLVKPNRHFFSPSLHWPKKTPKPTTRNENNKSKEQQILSPYLWLFQDVETDDEQISTFALIYFRLKWFEGAAVISLHFAVGFKQREILQALTLI